MTVTLNREALQADAFPVTSDIKRRTIGVMTPDEYFAFEEAALERHEFWNGKVVTMAGGMHNHSIIILNVGRTIAGAIEAAVLPHITYSSELQVAVTFRKRFYPDATVAEEPPRYDSKDGLLNPLILAEVLSPSTRNFDLNEKFTQYQTFASLHHFLAIESEEISVTHDENIGGVWVNQGTYTDLSGVLTLTVGATQIAVPLSRLYARIVFDETAP